MISNTEYLEDQEKILAEITQMEIALTNIKTYSKESHVEHLVKFLEESCRDIRGVYYQRELWRDRELDQMEGTYGRDCR